jgi:hypothetical protein
MHHGFKNDLSLRGDFTPAIGFDHMDLRVPRGRIDRYEIADFVREHYAHITDGEVDAIIRRCDTDEDEALSFDEFADTVGHGQTCTHLEHTLAHPVHAHTLSHPLDHPLTYRASTYDPLVTSHVPHVPAHVDPYYRSSAYHKDPYYRSRYYDSPTRTRYESPHRASFYHSKYHHDPYRTNYHYKDYETAYERTMRNLDLTVPASVRLHTAYHSPVRRAKSPVRRSSPVRQSSPMRATYFGSPVRRSSPSRYFSPGRTVGRRASPLRSTRF